MDTVVVGYACVTFFVLVSCILIYISFNIDRKEDQDFYNKDMQWEIEALKETAVITIYLKNTSYVTIKRKAYQSMAGSSWNMRISAKQSALNFLEKSYKNGYVEYDDADVIRTFPVSEIERTTIEVKKE